MGLTVHAFKEMFFCSFLFQPSVQFSLAVITYTETPHASRDTPSPAAKRHRHTLMCTTLSQLIRRTHLDRSVPGHSLHDHTFTHCLLCFHMSRMENKRQGGKRHPLMWCQFFFFLNPPFLFPAVCMIKDDTPQFRNATHVKVCKVKADHVKRYLVWIFIELGHCFWGAWCGVFQFKGVQN